jgi:hypothetical protein
LFVPARPSQNNPKGNARPGHSNLKGKCATRSQQPESVHGSSFIAAIEPDIACCLPAMVLVQLLCSAARMPSTLQANNAACEKFSPEKFKQLLLIVLKVPNTVGLRGNHELAVFADAAVAANDASIAGGDVPDIRQAHGAPMIVSMGTAPEIQLVILLVDLGEIMGLFAGLAQTAQLFRRAVREDLLQKPFLHHGNLETLRLTI